MMKNINCVPSGFTEDHIVELAGGTLAGGRSVFKMGIPLCLHSLHTMGYLSVKGHTLFVKVKILNLHVEIQ